MAVERWIASAWGKFKLTPHFKGLSRAGSNGAWDISRALCEAGRNADRVAEKLPVYTGEDNAERLAGMDTFLAYLRAARQALSSLPKLSKSVGDAQQMVDSIGAELS